MSASKTAGTVIIDGAGRSKAMPYVIAGGIVVGGVLLTYVVIKVMEALQLKDTREEKIEGRKAGKLTRENAFDPAWSRNHPSKVTISQVEAEGLAKSIYEASGYVRAKMNYDPSWMGWAYDEKEDIAKGAVRQARTSYNLSKVADVMYRKHKVGLLDHLQDFNYEGEMSKYYDIVDNFKS